VKNLIQNMMQNKKFTKQEFLKLRIQKVFHNLSYRAIIFLEGGHSKFVIKRLGLKINPTVKRNIKDNLQKHLNCVYSVYNGLWCSLPCLWCKKFKKIENSKMTVS